VEIISVNNVDPGNKDADREKNNEPITTYYAEQLARLRNHGFLTTSKIGRRSLQLPSEVLVKVLLSNLGNE
jgi:hypothetical protein